MIKVGDFYRTRSDSSALIQNSLVRVTKIEDNIVQYVYEDVDLRIMEIGYESCRHIDVFIKETYPCVKRIIRNCLNE